MTPKTILFVDDKLKNVRHVGNFCEKNKIKYFGFKYSYLDEEIKSSDPQISETQAKNFGRVLSNTEAKKMLLNKF